MNHKLNTEVIFVPTLNKQRLKKKKKQNRMKILKPFDMNHNLNTKIEFVATLSKQK